MTQLIVVSRDGDHALATSVERSGAEFVVAPPGSSRAEMCDLGMARVVGSIVAVRDDVAIGDAGWLDAYRTVVPRRAPAVSDGVPMEVVVMDTSIAGRAARADSPVPFAPIVADSIEMAEAV